VHVVGFCYKNMANHSLYTWQRTVLTL